MTTEETTQAPTVMSTGIKFGLYYGVFSIAYFIVIALITNPFDNKWNWISLIFSIGVTIWAQKSFKDEGDGYMSYGQGVGIGFWISLISLIIGGIFTFFYSSVIDTTLMDGFYESQRTNMETQNMPEDQIEMSLKWTKKLFWPIYAFMGMLFGVLVAVVVTIFTQRKNPEPFV